MAEAQLGYNFDRLLRHQNMVGCFCATFEMHHSSETIRQADIFIFAHVQIKLNVIICLRML